MCSSDASFQDESNGIYKSILDKMSHLGGFAGATTIYLYIIQNRLLTILQAELSFEAKGWCNIMQTLRHSNKDTNSVIIEPYGFEYSAVVGWSLPLNLVDFVNKLPGVNTKNLLRIMNHGESLDHLMTLSKDQLSEMLSNSQNAELLYNALHKPIKASTEPSSFRARGRGRGFRKRKT